MIYETGNLGLHKSPDTLRVTEGNEQYLRGWLAHYRRSEKWCNAIILPIFFF